MLRVEGLMNYSVEMTISNYILLPSLIKKYREEKRRFQTSKMHQMTLNKTDLLTCKKLLFISIVFNWRIIIFQCCGGLCCIATQSNHNYIYKHIYAYIYTHTHTQTYSLPLPPFHSSRLSQSQAELPVLYISFPLVICFTHDSVYMSVLLSQFVLTSLSPAVPTSMLSTSVSPFLLCK